MSIHNPPPPRHIVHLTSVHGRYDIRIYRKQCVSLARAGYRVSLVVADGLGDEVTAEGVRIIDAGRPAGRLSRMIRTTARVARLARSLDPDLYQFHDPELLPAGVRLKRAGKPVVFDSHEDIGKQVMGKPYLAPAARRVISRLVDGVERWAVGKLDAVIGATPSITAKFRRLARRRVNINNYPLLGELENSVPWANKENRVCYVGGISEARGILPLVAALEQCASGARLDLAGLFSEAETEAAARALPGWRQVDSLGFCDRGGVRQVLARSCAGMVTLAPLPNHVESLPIKMFEYMSAGIPVIASDFPLWHEIVVGNDCGLCVKPQDPVAIAGAIDELVMNPERAAAMGRNGQAAVREKFNWALEERKLLQLYHELLA